MGLRLRAGMCDLVFFSKEGSWEANDLGIGLHGVSAQERRVRYAKPH